jgi:signal transduction histidine kinase
MDRAVQILNAEAGSLLLMDPSGKYLTFEVVLGPTGDELLGAKTQVGKGIVGTVAESGKPLIINDVSADSRWDIGFDEATEFKTKDLLCVPMIVHNQVIGVIEVINKLDGTVFTDDECNLLTSFAAQAAIAIENAQRFTRTDQALAERVQELQTLQVFDQHLQTSLELANVADIALSHAMDALGVNMGVVGIIKETTEPGLYLLAQRGMPTEMGRFKIDPWPLARGIMGRVVRTGEPALVNDITQAKGYVPKTHRTRSLLAVPITREDQVIGVMNLESTDSDYFTEDDLAFVSLLVSQAAIAISNAQLFEQVRQANQAKTEFMNTASHELKIPMTSIKGYAKLLQMGAVGSLTDQQKEFLGVISNNVDRMDRLVSDLLDVSRIEARRIRLEIEDVQMRDVIDDVVEAVQHQIKNKDQHLSLNIQENLPEIRADYGRMVQIVTNLVSNAYKYTPKGGDITVTAKPYSNGNGEVEGVMVTVKDTGYGISEEDQAQLFTNFFRSSDQNIREEPGTGLGLSITKKMVETHGGELTFETLYGHGSAFTFTVPLVSKIPRDVEVTER